MSVMSTGELRSACAVNSPPKPEPMMTTRGRPLAEPFAAGTGAGDVVMMFPSSHLGRVPLLLGRSDPGHSRRCPPTRAFRAVPLVTMDVAYVFVPGLGLDERSSGARPSGRGADDRPAPAVRCRPGPEMAADGGARAAPVRAADPRPVVAHRTASAPRGRLVELVGAAHMTPQTHPQEVAALLRSLYD